MTHTPVRLSPDGVRRSNPGVRMSEAVWIVLGVGGVLGVVAARWWAEFQRARSELNAVVAPASREQRPDRAA